MLAVAQATVALCALIDTVSDARSGAPEHFTGSEPGPMMDEYKRRLRVGQPITPDEFELLSDAQLARLVPKAYREFFPGKENCADGHFYLHDGTAWCFYKGDLLDG
jgi:hypothetical protein